METTIYGLASLVVVIGLRSLMIRFLPEDFSGPDGWYFDSKRRKGIFDLPRWWR